MTQLSAPVVWHVSDELGLAWLERSVVVTVYPVIGEPSVSADAQVIDADPLPAVAVTDEGANGTPAGMLGPTVLDASLGPARLEPVTST